MTIPQKLQHAVLPAAAHGIVLLLADPLKLDPAITVIPIHAYVLLDSSGRPGPSNDSRFKESQTAVTTFLRQAFDMGFATNPMKSGNNTGSDLTPGQCTKVKQKIELSWR